MNGHAVIILTIISMNLRRQFFRKMIRVVTKMPYYLVKRIRQINLNILELGKREREMEEWVVQSISPPSSLFLGWRGKARGA